ncbi:MAG TPA: hypothetical protein VF611_17425 [Pyrinomonadaceae bacterium]|jgi:hypothetical protein
MANVETKGMFREIDFFDVDERELIKHSERELIQQTWGDKYQTLRALQEAETLRNLLGISNPAKKIPCPSKARTRYEALRQDVAANWVPPVWSISEGAGEGLAKRRATLIARVERTIESSRHILALSDNWDDEGSPGYGEATWERATQFVRHVATGFINEYRRHIAPPKITPGPDGGIDVRWKSERRTLLINFPSTEGEPADYFGSDKGRDTIKGTLDLSSQNLWLLMWLTR